MKAVTRMTAAVQAPGQGVQLTVQGWQTWCCR